MARGGHSPAPAIPKVSFTKVEDDASTQPAGVHDQQARSYGYNDFSTFQRPDHYLRYIEPLESELAVQVEYDMDEQDQEWLDAVNNERRADQLNKVSYEAFEIIMDRLEKEWFDLTKNIPKPDMALPSEDSTCAICDDAEGENSNAIVFCDGCNLAVHQDCYGVPYIPEGQWLCRKCTVSPENPVSCMLCPNEGGAFKQTTSGEWVHLLCAIWVPETRVSNDIFMEPITGVDRINKQRWKLKCSLCGIREGACIQCSKTSCFLAFHTTCARREKLLMPMKSAHGTEPATLACFCEKHLPEEQLGAHEAALAELSDVPRRASLDSDDGGAGPSASAALHTPRSSKTARAYAKTYAPGAPSVPALIVHRILDYIQRILIRKKPEFVQLVCRYWSLKREARRGAPLLKRLHLEPWTASAAAKPQTEEEIAIKLDYLRLARQDLEAVRMLADLVRKREAQKLKQVQAIHDVISTIFFPHSSHLRLAFEKIMTLDRYDFFKNPVSKMDVPDYFDVVKKPMCWKTIDGKLDANEYWNIKDFQDDVYLVLDNAMLYNKPGTPIFKAASKIRASSEHILGELQQLARYIAADSPEAGLVGDLEPPLSVLNLLTSIDAIDADIPLQLTSDPLDSLFAFELEKFKPPPPPPPPKPPRQKRDRKAEAERRKQRILDQAAGFRAPEAPRTRRAQAEADAFEAEAHGGGSRSESIITDAEGEGDVDEDEEGGGSSTDERASRRGAKWRRAPVVLPGRGDVPPVVDDVDAQRSFSMFDAGWILPSSTRRGGRAPIEKHELPPPRKRSRTDRQRSTLSYSTPATENQTLREATPPQEIRRMSEAQQEETQRQHKREESESVDLSDPHLSNAAPEQSPEELMDTTADAVVDEAEAEPEPEAEQEAGTSRTSRARRRKSPPRSTTIIMELDTPATRRAKHTARRQRRQEELAQEARERQTTGASAKVASPPPPDPQLLTVESRHEEESSSELSSLSALSGEEEGGEDDDKDKGDAEIAGEQEPEPDKTDDESQEVDEEPEARTSDGRIIVAAEDARKAAHAAGLGPATILIEEGDVLEGGTLETYPWWPAVVFEEDDPDVPPAVLREKREKGKTPRTAGGTPITPDYRQWLHMDKLRLLNEDPSWDAMMLNGNPKIQRFKTVKIKEQCRTAWRFAMAEMETSNMESEDVASAKGQVAGPSQTKLTPADDSPMIVDTEDLNEPSVEK
ncbi:hypothetical protein DFH11DRAFT_1618277 [Phellopilus nigrolimitatus]|nr:hypothetical protein DFH11DRAFT_1618277 [Phellopilus nigrolimitatus]